MIQRRLTVLLLTCMLVGAAIGTFVELGGVGWDFANYYNAGLKVLSGQPVDVYDPDATIDGKLPGLKDSNGHQRARRDRAPGGL